MNESPGALHVETLSDGSILLQGELDMATVKALEAAVAEAVRPGRPVVIDMAQLKFIDSSGISLLFRTWQTTGERVVICNPSRQVLKVLQLMDGGPKPVAWMIQAS